MNRPLTTVVDGAVCVRRRNGQMFGGTRRFFLMNSNRAEIHPRTPASRPIRLHFVLFPFALVLAPILLSGCGTGSQAGRDARDVVATIGQQGLSDGQFFYPRAIAATAEGRIFIADKTGRVQRFGSDGKVEKVWKTPIFKAGMPVGMGLAPDGRLFVADTHYNRVLIYSQEGDLLAQFGKAGHGAGEFVMPTDVAVDREGFIYVSETGGNDRISKFDADFNYIKSFGGADAGEAAVSRPVGLAIAADNTLWVADAVNHRLLHFSLDGKLVGQVGSIGSQPGQFRYPYDIVVLPDGSLLVAEFGNSRLQRVSADGKSLRTWGQGGWQVGQLGYPWGVAFAAGKVYVVDSGNNRIQVLEWE